MLISIIFIIGAIHALFLGLVLFFNNSQNKANRILIAWLLLIFFQLTFVYMGSSGLLKKFPHIILYGSSLMLLQGPFLYLYVLMATGFSRQLKWKYLLHLIPFVFFSMYFVIKTYSIPQKQLYEYFAALIDENSDWIVFLFGLLNHIHIIIYLLLSLLLIKQYNSRLPNLSSFIEGVNLRWLKHLLLGIAIIAFIIVIGLIFSDILIVISHDAKAYLIYIAFAILPFFMTFNAIRQRIIYVDEDVLEPDNKYTFGLTREVSLSMAERLTAYMSQHKPYLNPKLNIKELSEGLDLHPKHLSQIINENFDQNFFNYINAYRVKEFKERLMDPANDNYKLISIAYDSGFNAKSSFNSIFKKFTGSTPSAYKAGLNTRPS